MGHLEAEPCCPSAFHRVGVCKNRGGAIITLAYVPFRPLYVTSKLLNLCFLTPKTRYQCFSDRNILYQPRSRKLVLGDTLLYDDCGS